MTVTPTQRTQSKFPAFHVPDQPEFPTSYDAVGALEDLQSTLRTRNTMAKDGSSVLVPLEEVSHNTTQVSIGTKGKRSDNQNRLPGDNPERTAAAVIDPQELRDILPEALYTRASVMLQVPEVRTPPGKMPPGG